MFRFIHNSLIARLMMITICLLILLCGGYLLSLPIRSRFLFSELETLQLGHSTFEDAERLAKNIHVAPYRACDRSKCEWNKRIDNAWLPRWWRGSGETFSVFFSVQDSIVVRKDTAYGVGVDGSFHPSVVDVEEQEQWGRLNVRRPIQTGWGATDWYPYYEFHVWMTPKASAEDRRRYTSFNFNCFWNTKDAKTRESCCQQRTRFPMTNEQAASLRRTTMRRWALLQRFNLSITLGGLLAVTIILPLCFTDVLKIIRKLR